MGEIGKKFGSISAKQIKKVKWVDDGLGHLCWCGTEHNLENNLEKKFEDSKNVKYAVFRKEKGESIEDSKVHYQLFVILINPQRLSWMKSNISSGAHWEPKYKNSTRKQARDYCITRDKKGEFLSEPIEFGNFEEEQPGRRNDLIDLRLKVQECTDLKDVINKDLIKNPQMLNFAKECLAAKPIPKMENWIPREWQDEILYELSGPPDPRKVIWFWDRVGNSGKTELSNFIRKNLGGELFKNGKMADMAYQYTGERIAVFDFSRAKQKSGLPYDFIENVKDGVVTSSKYNSCIKDCKFGKPHVIVFANCKPEMSMLSNDRWDIRKIDKNQKGEFIVNCINFDDPSLLEDSDDEDCDENNIIACANGKFINGVKGFKEEIVPIEISKKKKKCGKLGSRHTSL